MGGSLCLFKSQVSTYRFERSQLHLKEMKNTRERDNIKAQIEYKENQAADLDSACAASAANSNKSYTQGFYAKAWKNSSEYKNLIAEEDKLEIEKTNIESELEFIDEAMKYFEKGEQNEAKDVKLWCFGG